MTQERLRELLRDRVADERMPDYAATAWREGRRARRRHRVGAAAVVAAATVGVSGVIAAVSSSPPTPVEPGDQAVPDPVVATPDATYQDVPIWWSPDQREEQSLEPIDSPLPAEIDLDASDAYVPGELDRAVAAFARGRSVVLVGPQGQLRTVDVSRLEEVTKPNGYSYFPTGTGMLTSDGDRLVFRQPGTRFAIFDIATGAWSSDTFVEVGPGPPAPGFDASAAQQYGEVRDGAATWGMGVPLPVRDGGRHLSNPEFLVADGAVLAFMDVYTEGQNSRYKNCCPVAGWLGPETVVYESRQTDAVLVAWRLRTHDFYLASRIRGDYDVASFAL